MKADDIITSLNLESHPEGGWFKETYRSDITLNENALPEGFSKGRNIATVIYFLLKSGEKSALHRLRSDEFWYFHGECPLEVFIIHPDGKLQEKILGNDISAGEIPQLLLPAGTWFAARPVNSDSYSLISCSVSPGFNFTDFELAQRKALINQFPAHKNLITEMT